MHTHTLLITFHITHRQTKIAGSHSSMGHNTHYRVQERNKKKRQALSAAQSAKGWQAVAQCSALTNMTASNKVLAGPGTKEFIQPDQWLSSPVNGITCSFCRNAIKPTFPNARDNLFIAGLTGRKFHIRGVWAVCDTLTDRTDCVHAWAIKSCHRDLWTALC